MWTGGTTLLGFASWVVRIVSLELSSSCWLWESLESFVLLFNPGLVLVTVTAGSLAAVALFCLAGPPALVEDPALVAALALVANPALVADPALAEDSALVADPALAEDSALVLTPALVGDSALVLTPALAAAPLADARSPGLGGLPEAIHPMPKRLRCSIASSTLLCSTGNSLRLSWPIRRLTPPPAASIPPVGASGKTALICLGSIVSSGSMM
jgi:hypothetical protein